MRHLAAPAPAITASMPPASAVALPSASEAPVAVPVAGTVAVPMVGGAAPIVQSQGGYFELTCGPRTGNARLVMSAGKVKMRDVDKQMVLLLPQELVQAIGRQIDGPKAPAVAAIVQWALQKLEQEQVTLTVRSSAR